MRKQHVRDLLKKIELDGDAVFQHYIVVRTIPGTIVDGDKFMVLGFRAFSDGEYISSMDYFDQADEIFSENDDLIGRVITNIMRVYAAGRLGELEQAAKFADLACRCADESGDRFLKVYALSAEAVSRHYHGKHEEGREIIAGISKMETAQDLNLLKVYADYYNSLSYIYETEESYDLSLKFAELAYFAYNNYYEGTESVNSLNALMAKAFALSKMNETIDALRILRDVEKTADNFGMYQSIMRSKKLQAEVYYQISEYEMAFIKLEEFYNLYAERMDDRLRNPEDEYQSLKFAVEISQDELMIKNGELLEKNRLLEELAANQTIVRRLGYALASARRVDEVFESFAEGLKEFVEFDDLTIGLVEGDEVVIKFNRTGERAVSPLPARIHIESGDCVISHVIRRNTDCRFGHVCEIREYVGEKDYNKLTNADPKSIGQSGMLVRLVYGEQTKGVLFIRSNDSYKYSTRLFGTVQALASFLSIAIDNAIQNEILDEKAENFEGIILVDELTGLENRRAYEAYTNKLFSEDAEYTIAFIDMNHLKKVNDGLGHEYGDRYLRAIAMVMNSLGANYRKFRLGGDEFVIIAEGERAEPIEDAIATIKKQCARVKIAEIPVAVAAGYAIRHRGGIPKAVLRMAEERMYADKAEYYQNIG